MTAPFERHKKHFGKSRALSFSLLYADGRSLDLCASSSTIFKNWFLGLRYLLELNKNEREHQDIYERFLRAKWEIADVDKNGSVSFREVQFLLQTMGLIKPVKFLKLKFKEIDRGNKNKLDFDDFSRFIDSVCRR